MGVQTRAVPRPTVVNAPAAVIDVARARLHCKIDGTARDAELTDAIAAAQAYVQEQLGVAIGGQRLAYTLHDWCGSVVIPYPITDVVSVEDETGAITYTRKDRLISAASSAPPVVVTIDCGLTAAQVPPPVKSAMLLLIADLIDNPQGQTEVALHENRAVANLLAFYQVRVPL